jgi:hypothetical protein
LALIKKVIGQKRIRYLHLPSYGGALRQNNAGARRISADNRMTKLLTRPCQVRLHRAQIAGVPRQFVGMENQRVKCVAGLWGGGVVKPGIYHDIPFPDYLKINAFHSGIAKLILKSAKKARWEMDNPKKSTPDMVFGSLIDCLLLEPDKFSNYFTTLPETSVDKKDNIIPFSARSDHGKNVLKSIYESGKQPISTSQIKHGKSLVDGIMGHPTAGQWLSGGRAQVTIIWNDPQTGVLCKIRPDYLRDDRITDLKTTKDAHPSVFSSIAGRMGYHIQAALYHDGLYFAENGQYPTEWVKPFSQVVAETEPAYDVICFDIQEESLDCGRELFHEAIQKYADCLESNKWPGYSDCAEPLDIPAYLIHRILYEGATDG